MADSRSAHDPSRARTLAQAALLGALIHLCVSLLEVAQPSYVPETEAVLRSGQLRLSFLGFGIGDVLMTASLFAWYAAGLIGTRMWARAATWLGAAGFLAFAAFHFTVAATGRVQMPVFAGVGMFLSQVVVPLAYAVAAFTQRQRAAGVVALALAVSPAIIFQALPQFVATAVHALFWAAFAATALRAASAPLHHPAPALA